MHAAIRITSALLALVILGASIYIGLDSSWPVAVFAFLLLGGVELAAASFSREGDKNREH